MHHICIIGLNDLIRFAITWGLVTCEKFRFNGTLCDLELFLKIKIILSLFLFDSSAGPVGDQMLYKMPK